MNEEFEDYDYDGDDGEELEPLDENDDGSTVISNRTPPAWAGEKIAELDMYYTSVLCDVVRAYYEKYNV